MPADLIPRTKRRDRALPRLTLGCDRRGQSRVTTRAPGGVKNVVTNVELAPVEGVSSG
ncbi:MULTISPECIES: hypothetical protein [Dickeya]|uniref:hypothetical protein n=1 Tax=Dickeya TaxID=204037 RepID=UPI000A5856E2|nr:MULTISPECIES: hypothetical protein [Dickeya]